MENTTNAANTNINCPASSTDVDSIDDLALDLFDAECSYPVDELSPEELAQIEADYLEWQAEKDLFDAYMDTASWQGDRYYDNGFGVGW